MYREFADIIKVKENSKLLVIDDFTCLTKNTIKTVYKDDIGLYILSTEGEFYLSDLESTYGNVYLGLYLLEE